MGGVRALGMLSSGLRAYRAGHRQAKVQGDPLQQGGVFVITPAGHEIYAQRSQTAGDHADLSEVVDALRSWASAEMHPRVPELKTRACRVGVPEVFMHLRPMAALVRLVHRWGCENTVPQDIKALESDADGGPEDAYEGDSPGECSDDADNDRDGLFDCEDPDCAVGYFNGDD